LSAGFAMRSMSFRATILLITLFSCVSCDQATKAAARTQLAPGQVVSLLGGTLLLEHFENPGAFLSSGASLSATTRRALFAFGGAALTAAASGWALFSKRLRLSGLIGAALICSGGVGNLIDRFGRDGYVTDFLNVGIGSLRTGIFNVADLVLMVGLALALHDGIADRH